MTALTVLDWTKRHRCQGCGARSTGHTLAGTMFATKAGWICAQCLGIKTCNSQARLVEPAPAGTTISGDDSPPLDEVAA